MQTIERPAHSTTRLSKMDMRGRHMRIMRNRCHTESLRGRFKGFVHRKVLCIRDVRRIKVLSIFKAKLGDRTWELAFDPQSMEVWSDMPDIFRWKPPGQEPEREPKTLEELGL